MAKRAPERNPPARKPNNPTNAPVSLHEPIAIDGPGPRVLLLHGFAGSTAQISTLARSMAAGGCAVYAPVLPGHEGGLMHVPSPGSWFSAAEAAYDRIRDGGDPPIVVGHSMGGALALHLAATRPVAKVVTLAASVAMPRYLTTLMPLLRWLPPWAFVGPLIYDTADPEGAKIAKATAIKKMTAQSVESFFAAIAAVRAQLVRITAPALIFHGRQDHTIPPGNAEEIYHTIGSPWKELVWLNKSYHVLFLDYERDIIAERALRFILAPGASPQTALPRHM